MNDKITITCYNYREIDVRKATNKFISLVEDHLLDPMDAIVMCAKWMSEDDIKEMCKANEVDLDMESEEYAD